MGVIDVKPLADHHLIITFDNNEQRIFDLRPYLDIGIFNELHDPTLFSTVQVHYDTIEWQNGADLDPELLYEKSMPL